MTATRRRLPTRIVAMATMVMTAAVLAAVAAVLNHCSLNANSGAEEGPITAWLNPEKVADQGHPSGSSLRLAGPSEPLAGAG